VQHIIYHLAPTGIAGFVLANGSMSSNQSGEGEIRKNIVEADLVDCMIALPGQLFYSTQIPACLWFLTRDKSGKSPSPIKLTPSPSMGEGRGGGEHLRDRRGQVLFIDARKLGRMVDRTHRELTDEEVNRIAQTYHAWRGSSRISSSTHKKISSPSPSTGEGKSLPPTRSGGEGEVTGYANIPGFCKSATLDDIRKHGHVLTPGLYVGAETVEDDGEPFEQKMKRLAATLRQQQTEAAKLDAVIAASLKDLGYGGI
jgi:type I restriction enzyme M protein